VLGGYGNFLRREAGDCKRNLVAVVVEPFDVVGRVVVLAARWAISARSKRRSKPTVERHRGEKS
jgi:hypothetical protein